jgi:hypothetical protein
MRFGVRKLSPGSDISCNRRERTSCLVREPSLRLSYGLISQGCLVDLEEALSQALELARRHEVNLFVPVTARQQGLALVQLGRTDEARQARDLSAAEADSRRYRSARLRSDIHRAAFANAVGAGGVSIRCRL